MSISSSADTPLTGEGPGAPEKEYVYKSTVAKVYGLTPSMIDELGGPDEVCENPHYRNGPLASLYRVERVEAWVEQNRERVEKAKERRAKRAAAAREARGRRLLTKSDLRRRGWHGRSVSRFLPSPDARRAGEHPHSVVNLYLTARVEEAEASPEFQQFQDTESRAKWERKLERWERRARQRAEWEAEDRRRAALRAGSLKGAFPGFQVNITLFPNGMACEVHIRLDRGPGAYCAVRNLELCNLVRGCEETGEWAPLVDWLLEHDGIGNPRFRAALHFLAVGDPEGWRAWRGGRKAA
jgi:hypothetical protein